jgi:methylmalonyl-CoA carboxyltransferase small subunit
VKYKLTVDGKTYEVDIEATDQVAHRPELPLKAHSGASAPAMPSTTSGTPPEPTADENKVCRSPIAGMVVKLSAQIGQTIQANDVLVVLEAMKMETTVTSPVAGKIAKVHVSVGDSVRSGQVVVEFA